MRVPSSVVIPCGHPTHEKRRQKADRIIENGSHASEKATAKCIATSKTTRAVISWLTVWM